MSHLIELCAGTAAVSLWALARVRPLTGYMGSKRRDADTLCTLLGCRDPDRVTLVDAGPWGDVWTVLSDRAMRQGVAAQLRAWKEKGTLPEVWPTLLAPPSLDPCTRVAQYLCLQARSTGCIPIWWSAEHGRWESPSGSRTETAHQRGGCDAHKRPAPGSTRDRMQPYQMGVPVGRKVGPLLPRARVLDIARAHADVAQLVVVSEASPLPLNGWKVRRLRDIGKPEWLTIHGAPGAVPEQLSMEAITPGPRHGDEVGISTLAAAIAAALEVLT